MNGEVKLKPCPFCGNDKKLVIRRNDCDNRFIRCYECGAEGPFHGEHDVVVAAWNRRALDPETKMLSNDDLAQDMAECILFFWLARKRPVINPASGRYESADAARMRLPYTWFGHMMRENTIHAVDVVSSVDGNKF